MCIFNFKLKSLEMEQKSGFTFVEVLFVIILVSFLYIVTMKVIEHNLDQKVSVYVYNLYNNLDNESKLLTKKLLEDVANGSNTALKEKINTLNSTDLKINAILETMDAKTYAKILANDFNTAGQINDDGVSEVVTISETYKDIDITNTNDMSRSFSYTVNDDGTPNIKYTPERDTEKMQLDESYCYLWSENRGSNPQQTLKQGANCMYAPTKTNIENLITSQNVNQWYKIDAIKNTISVDGAPSDLTVTVYNDGSVKNPDIQITTSNTLLNISEDFKSSKQTIDFVVDNYSLKDKNALFSTNNNLKFHILTTKAETNPGNVTLKRVYNYTLAYQQDAICPPTDQTNVCEKKHMQKYNGYLKNPTPNAICYFKQKDLSNHLANNSGYMRRSNYMTPASGIGAGSNLYCVGNSKIKRNNLQYGTTLKTWETTYFNDFPKPSENISSCSVRLDNIQKQEMLIKKMKEISTECYYYLYYVNVSDMTQKRDKIYNPFCDLYSNIRPSVYTQKAKEYYDRWNNFFNITKIERDTKNELNSSINEDNMSNTITFTYPDGLQNNLSYPNHFIYVAIDTSFNKGKMGTNIFAFEQFGRKIIPVGYLANNQNTPLKFNVITRNPDSFKIEKVNEKPLTFCEAMKYTGDKFSQYCGCKDTSNKIVTQYSKIAACDNKLGCIIRPVQKSSVK